MSRAQRLSLLAVAVLIAVVAIVVLASAGDDTSPPRTAAPAPQQDAAPDATPQATATPRPRLLRSGAVAKLRVEQGDEVRFRVRSDTDEEVHVHGYDREQDVAAGETVSVAFPADITGIFEIEFHGSGELIGELRVDPD